MILTPLQVAQYARQAGFQGPPLIAAIAIAHAESGFNSSAIGDVDLTELGEKSVGLWQINYRPSRDATGGPRDPQLNLGPLHNAQAALLISGGGKSFMPWSTYTSGAYQQYLTEARTAVNQLEASMPGPPPTIIAFQATPTGAGYWIVFSDGAVFAFGDAQYHGRVQLDASGVWRPA